jgi:hypothetical protein
VSSVTTAAACTCGIDVTCLMASCGFCMNYIAQLLCVGPSFALLNSLTALLRCDLNNALRHTTDCSPYNAYPMLVW